MAEPTDTHPESNNSSSPATVSKVASPPFDKPNANLILRSSESIDFRVRRGIMEEVSSVFEDMLSIPQPPSQDKNKDVDYDGDVPIVQLTEHSSTILLVLKLCYPGPGPSSPISKDSVAAVYEATRKYMMDWPMKTTEDQLMEWAQTEPYRVYAIALKLQFVDLIRHAAKHSLRYPLLGPYCEELEQITAGSLHRLLKYRQAHVDAMMQLMNSLFLYHQGDDRYTTNIANRPWGPKWAWFGCRADAAGVCDVLGPNAPKGENSTLYRLRCTVWFSGYFNALVQALTHIPAEVRAKQVDIASVCQAALRCGHCKERAKPDLESFRTAIVTNLTAAYTSVSFPLSEQIWTLTMRLRMHYVDRAGDQMRRLSQESVTGDGHPALTTLVPEAAKTSPDVDHRRYALERT
ncbi:hypothetical protein NLI96_g6161 [Meripilus lineatus]|uniref:BTB domain-containing protein n=1 Tax=Meripilus lineatus TaxID=2056292 RepID=A0AAD5V3F4_9APHY|nr:hypothetical protein NLI96_g6161 [Physisporinus lineatus]